MAIIDGYAYHIQVKTGTKRYWRCQLYSTNGCTARLITEFADQQVEYVKETGEHNHSPSPTNYARYEAIQKIKKRAAFGEDKPSSIITQSQSSLSSQEQASLPSASAQRQTIYRVRKSTNPNVIPEPKSLADFLFTPELATSSTGENCLISDSRIDSKDRVIILGTKMSVEYLEKSQIILMDGTFYTAPSLFYQVYTIFGLAGVGNSRRAFPLVFSLMTSKTVNVYRKMIQDLKSYCVKLDLDFHPRFIMTDFEQSVIRACKEEFRESRHGCLFHLGQVLFRSISKSGLRGLYGTSADFANQVRKFIALAFLKPEEIKSAFEDLAAGMPDDDQTQNFIDWFEKNYIGVTSTRKTFEALFPSSFWSIYDLVELGLPRTNNAVEAWHRRFKILVEAAHPGIVKITGKFKEELHYQENQISRVKRGEEDCSTTKFFKREKIRSIFDSKSTKTVDDYLSAISIHLKKMINI